LSRNCPPASPPGLEPPPFARGALNACSRLLKLADVRARATKMCGSARTRQKGCCLSAMIYMQPCIESTHSLCRTGLCGPSKIFRFFVVKSGFPGLLVSAEPRKMRAVAQKLCRVWLHVLFCALAGGLWVRPFLKSTHTDFGGVGWCRLSGSGLAVAGEATVPHNRFLFDVRIIRTDALGGCSPFQE
jgi:hypothetical protein